MKRTVDDADRAAISFLLRAATAADGHHPLSDHAWLDLVDGGRPGFAALVAWLPGHDHPVGYAQLGLAEDRTSWSIDLVIDPHHRFDGETISRSLLDRATETVASEGGGHVHWWVSHPNEAHDRLAAAAHFVRGRDLWQMRVRLPLHEQVSIGTRPFVVGGDEDAWLEVNNRAFHWHPEQGGWTRATLDRRVKEPWFDPEGFLLHERDGRVAGFCWTKIHPDNAPPLGEIYVIAVSPDFQGLGLGRALVVAGLDSMHHRGLSDGMLYVDADNTPAVRLYQSMGFFLDHVNRAYVADVHGVNSDRVNEG